jgi:hypothetical protein
MQRYNVLLERLISPETSFPAVGRSNPEAIIKKTNSFFDAYPNSSLTVVYRNNYEEFLL